MAFTPRFPATHIWGLGRKPYCTMPETPKFLEYRSSKSTSVLQAHDREDIPGLGWESERMNSGCTTQVNTKTEMKMRMKWMRTTLIVIGMAALTGAAAYGQDAATKPKAEAKSGVETDAGLSGYATFTSATSGAGIQQTPSNSYGGMIELRQLRSDWLGYEAAFNFNPADQKYAPKTGACQLACQDPVTSIKGNAPEFTIDYIISHKIGNLRPFAVGGAGFFITIPGATPYGNNTSVRGAYVAGGGLDYDLGKHLGVRVQYRETWYKAPNISSIYPATGQLTQTGEPTGGVYYRF
jgi:opacity protein-like surface antigen